MMSRKKEQCIEKILLENYDQYYRLAYSYTHNEADAINQEIYEKCEQYKAEAVVAFAGKIKAAMEQKDIQALADLTAYPCVCRSE